MNASLNYSKKILMAVLIISIMNTQSQNLCHVFAVRGFTSLTSMDFIGHEHVDPSLFNSNEISLRQQRRTTDHRRRDGSKIPWMLYLLVYYGFAISALSPCHGCSDLSSPGIGE